MAGTRLATAEWMNPAEVQERYEFEHGHFFIGRSPVDGTPLGFHDDRHICLVAGTRSGKGTTTIVNNLCAWPGSIVVNDPKGENATVTAARRGDGSEYCEGLGQAVHVLDPFRVSHVEEKYRSRFNPLDALDPKDPNIIDDATALAEALVPTTAKDDQGKFFETSARDMLKALILHVRTAPEYEGRRNLITVRKLIMCGDLESLELAEEHGLKLGTTDPDELLWMNVSRNEAVPALQGLGRFILGNLLRSERQYSGSRETAAQGTRFLDAPLMQECVCESDFKLSDLKTDPNGVSVYLCLPSGKRADHYLWLRMITALFVTEMEKVAHQPACGHHVLLALDEFAGLKKMDRLEQAAAELAGFGVKLFFVVQSLVQLKEHYGDGWEVFLSNAGLKLFFGVDDNFTCEYISKMLGETEVPVNTKSWNRSTAKSRNITDTTGRTMTEGRSRSVSDATNESITKGSHQGANFGRSINRNFGGNEGTSESYSRSYGSNWSDSTGESVSDSVGHTKGGGRSESKSWDAHKFLFRNTDEYTHWLRDNEKANRASNESWGRSHGRTRGNSRSQSRGGNDSASQGISRQSGTSWNQGEGETAGVSFGSSESNTVGHGHTEGYSDSSSLAENSSTAVSEGNTDTEGTGGSVTLQKRPLATIDELRFMFDRVEEGGFGWCLVLAGGKRGMIATRCRYFEDDFFAFHYDPHPDHPAPPKLVGVETMALPEKIHPRIIDEGVIEWDIAPGHEVERAQTIARVRLPVPTGDEGEIFKQVYTKVDSPEALFPVQATMPGTVTTIGPSSIADVFGQEERVLAGFTVNRRKVLEIEDGQLVQQLEIYSKFLYDLPAEVEKLREERRKIEEEKRAAEEEAERKRQAEIQAKKEEEERRRAEEEKRAAEAEAERKRQAEIRAKEEEEERKQRRKVAMRIAAFLVPVAVMVALVGGRSVFNRVSPPEPYPIEIRNLSDSDARLAIAYIDAFGSLNVIEDTVRKGQSGYLMMLEDSFIVVDEPSIASGIVNPKSSEIVYSVIYDSDSVIDGHGDLADYLRAGVTVAARDDSLNVKRTSYSETVPERTVGAVRNSDRERVDGPTRDGKVFIYLSNSSMTKIRVQNPCSDAVDIVFEMKSSSGSNVYLEWEIGPGKGPTRLRYDTANGGTAELELADEMFVAAFNKKGTPVLPAQYQGSLYKDVNHSSRGNIRLYALRGLEMNSTGIDFGPIDTKEYYRDLSFRCSE